jgi:RING finger protein 170
VQAAPAALIATAAAAAAPAAAAAAAAAQEPEAAAAAAAAAEIVVPPAIEAAECPICLDEAPHWLETNCGHAFHAVCFLEYFRRRQPNHGNNNNDNLVDVLQNRATPAPPCPLCRRQVNALHAVFLPAELAEAAAVPVLQDIAAYNARFSQAPRSVMDMVRDAPLLLRRLWHDLSPGVVLSMLCKFRFMWFMLLTVLYLLSPIDLIPEAVFGVVGLVDDAIVFCMALVICASAYRQLALARAARRAHQQ